MVQRSYIGLVGCLWVILIWLQRNDTVDPKEELWTTGQTKEVGQDIEVKPIKVPAVINNYPGFSNSELFVKEHNISNHPGMQMSKGTDKVFGIYSIDNKDYDDILIQDGDIKKIYSLSITT